MQSSFVVSQRPDDAVEGNESSGGSATALGGSSPDTGSPRGKKMKVVLPTKGREIDIVSDMNGKTAEIG
jgi:hypothetical protein